MTNVMKTKIQRDLVLAFARVHILHHAAEGPIFGLEMMEELRRHGYVLGPGTLYPVLHALEEDGILTSKHELVNGKRRRYYRSTRAGIALLNELRAMTLELVDEVTPSSSKHRLAGETIHRQDSQKPKAR